MKRKEKGEFLLPDATTSGLQDIYITETHLSKGELRFEGFHGWAELPWSFAAGIAAVDGNCELRLESGKTIPVLITSTAKGTRPATALSRFTRRTV